MKLYEKPELTKVDVLLNERLMTDCEIVGSIPDDLPPDVVAKEDPTS